MAVVVAGLQGGKPAGSGSGNCHRSKTTATSLTPNNNLDSEDDAKRKVNLLQKQRHPVFHRRTHLPQMEIVKRVLDSAVGDVSNEDDIQQNHAHDE